MKILTGFLLFSLGLMFTVYSIGCSKSSEGQIPKTTNLTIIADAEGDGVILSWDAIQDIDGYNITTPDGDTMELNWNENSYNDDTPSTTGEYVVNCFMGSLEGDTSQISSIPYASSTPVTLYVYSSNKEFTFGWDPTTGIGSHSFDDFYLNDITLPFDFTSGDEAPYNGDRTSHILNQGDTDFFIAPSTGYYNSESVYAGDYYAFNTQGDWHAKVYVTATTDSTAVFHYWFQTIQSLRIF
jgi:hypothetical protein